MRCVELDASKHVGDSFSNQIRFVYIEGDIYIVIMATPRIKGAAYMEIMFKGSRENQR